ncbi:MAG: hypothetical protein KF774_15510 [Planctomyces sp.]|nr:hypothetical protein [Planctomyces sp.]
MFLAALDFDVERFRLLKLIIAIAQPVLLVLLCVGFVVASVHLLTMLSTRWGHRRVSTKAMLFSLAVHCSLATGIVALIPEYRYRVWARLQEEEPEQRIEIVAPSVDANSSQGANGGLAMLRNMAQPVQMEFSRTDRLDDPFLELPQSPERAPGVVSLPDVAETPIEPPPVEPTAERIAAAEAILQEFAAATLPEPELTTESRPEAQIGAPEFTRTSIPSPTVPPEPDLAQRPPTGAVERITSAEIEPVEPNSLLLDATPQATIARGDDVDITRRPGVIATPAHADPTTGAELPNTAAPASPSPGTPIARTGPLRPDPGNDPTEMIVERPRVARPSTPAPAAPSIDGPLAPTPRETPSLARIESGAPVQMPATYQMRTPDLQERAVQQFGGSEESEAAVERSLKFLAFAQEEDGRWNVGRWEGGLLTSSPDNERRDFISRDLDVGVTALATLAFLGKANTVRDGEYAENVLRAIRWLVARQHANGFIGIEARNERTGTVPGNMAGMYGHAMATFALAEAYAISRDHPEARALRGPVEKAIGFILATQLEDGGWRYFQYQTQGGDMSLFGWQLMALKSAQLGGIPVPAKIRDRMVDFLRTNARGQNGGLAAYRKGQRITPAMTAESLFCRQILGVGRDAASSREAVAYLLSPQNLPARQRMDLYHWYYGTLSLFQYGGAEWNQWNVRVRDLLISEQVQDGEYAGSWPPRDPWSGYGGRIYSTAMATLCLEVYYRYLPLYRQAVPGGPAPAEPTPQEP